MCSFIDAYNQHKLFDLVEWKLASGHMVHDFSTQPNLSEGIMGKHKICKGLLPTKKIEIFSLINVFG